jgi:D-glycerate 3-kinase
VRVLLVEGWCVGFRPLPDAEIEARWLAGSATTRTLHLHKLEHLQFVNAALGGYDVLTDALDAFIHVDAADTACVYEWRRQQEATLWRETGSGMTDAQVTRFVDAYYPAYELYLDGVRGGIFPDRTGCQLRLVVDEHRTVVDKFIL